MPSDWTPSTLGECADFMSGGTPSKSNGDYWNGYIPWFSGKDLKSFYLNDSEDHLTHEGADTGSRLVPAGTILLLVRGMTLHNDVPIGVVTRESAFNQDIKALQAKDGMQQSYLAHWLVSQKPRLLSTVHAAGHGTGVLATDRLKALDLDLPSPNEQATIANMFDLIEGKIEQNRRTAAKLEELARATFRAWFVDFAPVHAKAAGQTAYPGLPPAAFAALPTTFIDSPLGPIPKGWEAKAIGEVVTIKGGGTPSTKNDDYWDNGENAWATPKDLSGITLPVLLDTMRHITDAGVENISSGLLPVGTVLMSSRAPVGYLAITAVKSAINQGFIAMICEGPLPNVYILRWAEHSMETIKGNASGTTFAEINKKNFRPLPVIVPPPLLAEAFEQYASPMHSLLVAGERESRQLASLRDYLLPRLLSGTARVR